MMQYLSIAYEDDHFGANGINTELSLGMLYSRFYLLASVAGAFLLTHADTQQPTVNR